MELLSSYSSTSDQATQLRYSLSALADEVRHEKNYLSKSVDFPFLSPTVLKYMISTNFHLGAIDKSLDSIKKTFNMLALLAPPTSGTDDYERYIATSRNNELEVILDQPSEKRSAVKKEIFIKGRQESIEHVLNFIANIVVFARFWVKMTEESTSQPTFVQILVEVADYISTSEYKYSNEQHIATKVYMSHTLIAYLFNIISVFVKMGKTVRP